MRLRKPRRWRPILRPAAGRKLPAELRADAVGGLAAALPEGLRDPGFAVLLRRIDQSPILEGNRVRACFRGVETFEAMRKAIDAARAEVLVESYIFKDDATGRSLLETFARAVDRGVRVCVLADAFGSIATRRAFWNEMRSRGVEVRLFNPLFPHLLLQPFRDHRKILVVDCATAFTGGMNIGDEYGSGLSAHGGPWRDTHVQVDGPAAWAMATVFTEAWLAAGGSPVELPLLAPETGGVPALVLDSRPGRGHGETASVLAAIVAATRKRLWITNAYFAPRRRAVEVLGQAAGRGVDVRILLPGLNDVPLVRHAGHGNYAACSDAAFGSSSIRRPCYTPRLSSPTTFFLSPGRRIWTSAPSISMRSATSSCSIRGPPARFPTPSKGTSPDPSRSRRLCGPAARSSIA